MKPKKTETNSASFLMHLTPKQKSELEIAAKTEARSLANFLIEAGLERARRQQKKGE